MRNGGSSVGAAAPTRGNAVAQLQPANPATLAAIRGTSGLIGAGSSRRQRLSSTRVSVQAPDRSGVDADSMRLSMRPDPMGRFGK